VNTPEQRRAYIETIATFPDVLEALVTPLTEAQLHTHFIPHEWTVAQNVHHLADSHMNSFIRFKLLLTEDNPTIKPYNQDAWAVTPDYQPPITASLAILRGLHTRWAALLNGLGEGDWARQGRHPESGAITIDSLLKSYHDHCHAHIDQITRTLAAQGS
jgi:hypothetical protein